jgi:pimeloyl-ACP methyl ester carboxylesterase
MTEGPGPAGRVPGRDHAGGGQRGHGGFTGLLLDSVSANVAEHASCPVLVIHGDQDPPE